MIGEVAGLAIYCVLAGPASAHDFTITDVTAVLRSNGTFRIEMIVDVDALALGVPPSTDSAEVAATLRAMSPSELTAAREMAKETISRRVRIKFDGVKVAPAVSFPGEEMPTSPEDPPTILGIIARLNGEIPPEAIDFTFGCSRAFGPVHLAIIDQISRGNVTHILGPSEDSPPHTIGSTVPPTSRLDTAGRYLMLGFTHILPHGLDHILFVLGLFLLSARWRPLLWQITAFTVAHTATLGLSITGVFSLPSEIVEPLIALSIAYVAVENIFTERMGPWRPALVFMFGLLHGLGFADVLHELGLPPGELVTALAAFNIGVEFGQIAVVLLAFAAVGWARKRDWYHQAIVIPISAAIALTGLYWTVERTLGG